MDIAGGVALVTGGGSGLGMATARHVHSRGAHVVILDKNGDAARLAAENIGERATWVKGSILDDHALTTAIEVAMKLGGLRMCFAIAGGAVGWEQIVEPGGTPHSIDLFRETLELNLIGTFNTVRLAAAAMSSLEPIGEDAERGVIITTSSIVGIAGQSGQAAYGCAKSGVIALTKIAAHDLAGLGIRINCIVPSLMLTETWHGTPEDVMARLSAKVPFPKRFGEPAEFALLAEHLVVNPYLNGHPVRIDAGIRDLAT